jgi:hypothetical protein
MHHVVSPILYATPFVGKRKKHPTQEGKLWLSCAEYGYSFCCAEIDEPINPGDIVRIEVQLDDLPGWTAYPLNEAAGISRCAERMLGQLFGQEFGTNDWDIAVLEWLGWGGADERDPSFPNLEEFIPGDIYYKVRFV